MNELDVMDLKLKIVQMLQDAEAKAENPTNTLIAEGLYTGQVVAYSRVLIEVRRLEGDDLE